MSTGAPHITFILPGRGTKPVGGFKIIYEYANRLACLGMKITLVHTAWLYKSHPFLAGIGRYFFCLFSFRFYRKWFPLNPEVRNKWVLIPASAAVPDAEFVFASSWETAEHVASLPESKGVKMYLIQADESEYKLAREKGWEERARKTWDLPLNKIAVSSWLQQRIVRTGNKAVRIFNGLDFRHFNVQVPIQQRTQPVVMMLYHDSAVKGWKEGLEALREVKKTRKDLKVILFGVPAKPADLEDWIEYHQLPSTKTLAGLYNKSAVYLAPSHSEGWGLPVSEAMACGCAVLCSNIGGFSDVITNGETGLVFTVKNVSEMAEKLILLLSDASLRFTLASKGNRFIQQFTWSRAVDDMTTTLTTLKA